MRSTPARLNGCSRTRRRRSAHRRSSSTTPVAGSAGPSPNSTRRRSSRPSPSRRWALFMRSSRPRRRMVPAGKGAILLTGATAGIKGFALSAPFAMGKFALRGLAQSAARELSPKGIHVAHIVVDGGRARRAARRSARKSRQHTAPRRHCPIHTSTCCASIAAPGRGNSRSDPGWSNSESTQDGAHSAMAVSRASPLAPNVVGQYQTTQARRTSNT